MSAVYERGRSLEVMMNALDKNPDVELHICRDQNQWLDLRSNYVTASDIATLFGRSSYRSLYRLYHEKLGLLNERSPEAEWQRAGHYLEPAITNWYADDTGRDWYNPGTFTLVTNKRYPGLAATLDRVVHDRRYGCGVLELKNRGLTTNEDWKNGIPDTVRMQMQAQMLVTGLCWGSAAALVGGNQFYWGDVFRNAKFQAAIVWRVAQFWKDLKAGNMPALSDHPDDEAVLSELHPGDNGETVFFPPEFTDVYEELHALRSEIAKLSARESQLKNQIKSAIGSATFGVGPGFEISLKSQTTSKNIKIPMSSHDEVARITGILQRHGIDYQLTGGTTSRVMRIKETT